MSFQKIIGAVQDSEYYEKLVKYINEHEKRNITFYPKKTEIFKPFKETPYEKLKVVIVGNEPYHDGSATGLAFANDVDKSKINPSLFNIVKELSNDIPDNRDIFKATLEHWAQQGVLLLNSSLTVQKSKPGSHAQVWEQFTRFVISELSKLDLIWVLWGKEAKKFKPAILNNSPQLFDNEDGIDEFIYDNEIIECSDPITGNQGFFGSRPFSKINNLIHIKHGEEHEIDWYDFKQVPELR